MQISNISTLEIKNNLDKLINNLSNELQLTTEKATALANEILEKQKTINEGQAIYIQATQTLSYYLLLTATAIHCLGRKIGSGTDCDVFEDKVFPTKKTSFKENELTPSKVGTFALKKAKRARTTVSPQRKALDQIIEREGIQSGVDQFLDVVRDQNDRLWTVHKRYDGNLTNFPFHELTIEEFLQKLIQVTTTSETFHKNNLIHRDFKPANLLFLGKEEFALTDFTLLQTVQESTHRTTGTPAFLDGRQFGDEENNVLNQRNQDGKQTTEGDVFAWVLTMIECLTSYFSKTSGVLPEEKKTQILDLITKINYKVEMGRFPDDFPDEKLKEIGRLSNYRVMHDKVPFPQDPQSFLDKFYVYPLLNEMRRNLVQVCVLLNDHLDKDGIDALICLSHLICNAQEPSVRPSMTQLRDQMESILEIYRGKSHFTPLKTDFESRVERTPTPVKRARGDLTQLFEEAKIEQAAKAADLAEDCPSTQSCEDEYTD